MSAQLQLGLVYLDMGNMSHVLDLPRTKHDFNKYMQYNAFISKLNRLV